MPIKEFNFDPSQILQPAFADAINRLSPAKFGPNLSITKGQAVAKKTSDNNMYPLNVVATDGTQVFGGFNEQTLETDAAGLVYFTYGSGSSAAATAYTPASNYASIYTSGVFVPEDLFTSATGTATAEVDTITPTSPTTGDIYSVYNAAGLGVEVTIGATQTAAATVTLLKNAWNADPALVAIATPSGSATFILTAVAAGEPLGLTASTVGTGTAALVITTAAVSAQQSEVDTFTPSSPATGDIYTVTITYPNGTTHAVSATVGATQTPTATSTLLQAAWAADGQAARYATPSGTATFILTGQAGSKMNLASTVVGSGTVSKVVTTPAYGRNIADILPGAPGARVLQPSGYWRVA